MRFSIRTFSAAIVVVYSNLISIVKFIYVCLIGSLFYFLGPPGAATEVICTCVVSLHFQDHMRFLLKWGQCQFSKQGNVTSSDILWIHFLLVMQLMYFCTTTNTSVAYYRKITILPSWDWVAVFRISDHCSYYLMLVLNGILPCG